MKKAIFILIGIIAIITIIYGSMLYIHRDEYMMHASIRAEDNVIINDIYGMQKTDVKTAIQEYCDNFTWNINGTYTNAEFTGADIGLTFDDNITALSDYNKFLWPFKLMQQTQINVSLKYSDEEFNQIFEKLLKTYDGTIDSSPAQITVDDENYQLIIHDAVPSNQFSNKDAFKKELKEKIESLHTDVEIDKYLKCLETSSEYRQMLESLLASGNSYLTSRITLEDKSRNISCTLSANDIFQFLEPNDDATSFELNEKDAKNYITWLAGELFNTTDSEKTFYSPANGVLHVAGGTYGYKCNASEMASEAVAHIGKPSDVTIIPEYTSIEDESKSIQTFIEVDIENQMVYLVKDGEIVMSSECVTGNLRTSHESPTGVYTITHKMRNHLMRKYNSFVYYWMPYDDTEGIGLHDATWRYSFGGEIYKTNGSHGCINLPKDFAAELYDAVEVGMFVVVH